MISNVQVLHQVLRQERLQSKPGIASHRFDGRQVPPLLRQGRSVPGTLSGSCGYLTVATKAAIPDPSMCVRAVIKGDPQEFSKVSHAVRA